MKKILITGANSFVGTSFDEHIKKNKFDFEIDTIDVRDNHWRECDFSKYDSVFHVAGIAHSDVSNVSEERKSLYYKVNTDLPFEIAKKAKKDGVKQFVFMSSMIIFSGCNNSMITLDTTPNPINFYGDSKLQAEIKLSSLRDNDFSIAIVRSPMIYGYKCKGNFKTLEKISKKVPIFPFLKNKRSMIYIENLCEFIYLLILYNENGIFYPQNDEYVSTPLLVKELANINNHRIHLCKLLVPFVKLAMLIPGKIKTLATKAFGDFYYDKEMSKYKINYNICDFNTSVRKTEKGEHDS